MPYLHLDLPGTYPVEVKRELASRLCKLYAEVMETQPWRPNVGIAELGKDNLYHLGPMVLNQLPWSWSSFGAAGPPTNGWLWVERSRHLRRAIGCASTDRHGRVHAPCG
jgi:phenylpyruvate tautomerase PptA (4-oxalocrotonate tautomerase family)